VDALSGKEFLAFIFVFKNKHRCKKINKMRKEIWKH
jgi:hypothetical protein